MKTEKYFFRIKKSEQGKYSTSKITLDENLASKYSPETVERAKELKAKNQSSKQNFSDEYYLNYAKSLQLQDILGALNEIHHNRLANLAIQDKDWAGYSYEEIIEMENLGIKIPEEVLLWAHAQQESDVTDYIIVTDSINSDDANTTEDINSSQQLQNLQKKARENIIKSEKAEKALNDKVTQYNETKNKAEKIKKSKEDSYKNEIKKMEALTDEWKILDDKKKNGKLSFTERLRYSSLSKKLQGNSENGINAINADSAILDEFLTSLDGLKNDISANSQLAQDTLNAGKDLSEYEKNYHQAELPIVISGTRTNGMGLDSESLYGENGVNIANIAIETGKDLDITTNETSTNIQNKETIELNDFAQDFTTKTQQFENNTPNITINNEEQSEKDENTSDETKLENTDIPLTQAKKQNQKISDSTENLKQEQNNNQKEQNFQNQELINNSTNIKNLNTQSQIIQEKQAASIQKGSELVKNLKTIQAANQQPDLKEQINIINNQNTKYQNDINKNLIQNIQSNAKTQKISNNLTAKNTNFDPKNQAAQQTSNQIISESSAALTQSLMMTAIGNAMLNTGMALMSSIVTYNTGLTLAVSGKAIQNQGENELAFGINSVANGAIGYEMTLDQNKNNTQNSIQNNDLSDTKAQETNTQVQETKDINTNESKTETEIQPEKSTQQTEQEKISNEKTDNTEESDDTNNVNDSEQTDKSEENQTEETQEEENTYTVSREYSADNAQKAAQTTKQATNDLKAYNTQVGGLQNNVNSHIKKSKTILQNIEKEAKQTANEHQKNIQTTNEIKQNFDNAKIKINNAQTQEQVTSAQDELITISNEYTTTIAQDFENTTNSNKVISSNSLQLDKFKTNAKTLNSEISTFDKKIANQLEVSNTTIDVGIGTNILGVWDTIDGSKLIASGTALMSNPFTFNIGLLQTILGGIEINKGILEITLGTNAIVEGIAGKNANAQAKDTLTESQNIAKISNNEFKQNDKQLQELQNNLKLQDLTSEPLEQPEPKEIENSEEEENQENIQEDEQEKFAITEMQLQDEVEKAETEFEKIQNTQIDEQQNEDSLTISAAVTANANINNELTTDDKVDRKLSRFNMESIIESKKKLQRVQAVSASARNGK